MQEDSQAAGQADVDDSDAGAAGDDNEVGQNADDSSCSSRAPKISQDKDNKGTQALEEALSGLPPR